MRVRAQHVGLIITSFLTAAALSACAAKKSRPATARSMQGAQETYAPTPFPTVPPSGSVVSPTPVRTKRPVRKGKPGEPIGPEITFLGITRADGKNIDPESVDSKGVATYKNFVGSGFQLVIEARPGLSGYDVGRRLFGSSPTDPKQRPDLEIEVDRPLGDGSPEVCDRMRPHIGGVPAIKPPSFAETQKVADTLNDLSCRFEVFIDSESACTLDSSEDWAYKKPESEVQFCMMVARAWNFPVGETLISVRLRDRGGNPGPVKQIRLLRPKEVPRPPRRVPKAPPTPKPLPTRQ